MKRSNTTRNLLILASAITLWVTSSGQAYAGVPRHLDCRSGQLDLWLEADGLSYSASACLVSLDRDRKGGRRVLSASGLMEPGGRFALDGEVGPDSVDFVLRRGEVTQRLLLTDVTFRSIETLPDGTTRQRFIDFSEGGLLERLKGFEEEHLIDPAATRYGDMPLHGIAMQIVGELAQPADLPMLALLARAPWLQQVMNPSEIMPLAAKELDERLSTRQIETAMTRIDPIEVEKPVISVGCGAFDALDAQDGSERSGRGVPSSDVRTLEECRCIEDDTAHAKVGHLAVSVPGLGEVSFAGVEAFTHARCLEDDADCIKSKSKGGINTSTSFGGTCEGGGTKIMGIKAGGEGFAEASQGDCLKDKDDYACVGRVSASGIDFSWASVCGDTENALCMKAEATVDMSISLCTVPDSIIPSVESSGSVHGTAGGC